MEYLILIYNGCDCYDGLLIFGGYLECIVVLVRFVLCIF